MLGSAVSPQTGDRDAFVEDVRRALYASKVVAYAQGFDHIGAGSDEYDWGIDRGMMATIWRGGCIIRARFLNRIREAYDENAGLPSLLVAPYFVAAVRDGVDSWRRVVAQAATAGIPSPGVLLVAGLLRRPAPGPAARRADPGPAGQFRRAHLPPGGQAGHVPHRVGGRPAGTHSLSRLGGPRRGPELTTRHVKN